MPGEIETFGRSIFLFDLDGTLLDSMPLWREAIRQTAEDYGITLPDGFYPEVKTYSSDQVADWLYERHHMTASPSEFLARFYRHVADFYLNAPLKSGALEALDAYQRMGCTTVLLTGTDRELFTPCLDRLDLKSRFTATWSCREAGGTKATATPFRRVLNALGAKPSDAVLFEDSVKSAAVAAELGILPVGVYDEISAEDAAAFRAVTPHYLEHWDELFLQSQR